MLPYIIGRKQMVNNGKINKVNNLFIIEQKNVHTLYGLLVYNYAVIL